ncbi:hypothetical protein Tco_0993600 [Tanacetum coccineum]
MMKHIKNLRNNTHNQIENSPPLSSSNASPIKRTNLAKRNTAPFAELNGRTETSPVTGKMKPPRPPGASAVKRKLSSDLGGGDGSGASGSAGSTDTGVQVSYDFDGDKRINSGVSRSSIPEFRLINELLKG